MKASTRNRTKGLMKEAKGRAKAAAGRMTRSKRLERKGRAEAVRGRVQRRVGQVQQDLEDAEDYP